MFLFLCPLPGGLMATPPDPVLENPMTYIAIPRVDLMPREAQICSPRFKCLPALLMRLNISKVWKPRVDSPYFMGQTYRQAMPLAGEMLCYLNLLTATYSLL